MVQRYPVAVKSSSGFVVRDGRAVRDALLARGGPTESGFVRHAYRPFDTRWLYWETGHGLLGRPVPEYRPHVFAGNLWLGSNKREIHDEFTHGTTIEHLGNWKLANWGIHFFPMRLCDNGLGTNETGSGRRPNLSPAARRYLDTLGMGVEDLFHHVLAVLHDPAYRQANAGALRMEWPRIPLPGWPDPTAVPDPSVIPAKSLPRTRYGAGIQGEAGEVAQPGDAIPTKERHPVPRSGAVIQKSPDSLDATPPQPVIPAKAGIQTSDQTPPGQPESALVEHAAALAQSAARGRDLARLLDPETPVPGVTTGPLRPEIAAIAVPSTIDGRNMSGDDFELTAGWGHFGAGQAVMPGQGRAVQRPYTPTERQSLDSALGTLGNTTPTIPAKNLSRTPIPDRNPEEHGVAGHSMHPEPVEGRTSPLPQSVIPAKSLPRTRYGAGIQKPPDSPDPTPPQLVIPAKAGRWIHISSATVGSKKSRPGSDSPGTCVACCCTTAPAP